MAGKQDWQNFLIFFIPACRQAAPEHPARLPCKALASGQAL